MPEYKTINLEEGMPRCEQAIRRLTFELNNSKRLGVKAVKLIHGYGSSGTGGSLRLEVRRYLDSAIRKGLVKSYIIGEDFSIFSKNTLEAFTNCSALRGDSDLERHNNGITIVLI